MTVGILGLGLIGGSMARAYTKVGHTVLAADTDENMLRFAQLSGAVSDVLDESSISKCDLLLLAIYPKGCIAWLEKYAHLVNPGTLVMDLCGIKEEVCQRCFPLAKEFGFTFIGAHPMAGSHYSGFKYSRSNLFQGAPMVLVPPRFDDMQLLDQAKQALAPCGFGRFSVCTAQEHDRLIAFTSQMPHVLSNAFIKSPTALSHKGFSAGSYKDLTRVAWLNAPMWAELCMENRENMLFELNTYIRQLQAYRTALEKNDIDTLTALFDEGRRRKEAVDG
ncbi:MAG: prephenate dehydrogenase/arogenate dehydrogenase family protein [Ruminococcaceae bacterium]|nr:prephenate dehydrogenase/arogenate dehydrogenase family protein [Oscillospiraceae bacterium]